MKLHQARPRGSIVSGLDHVQITAAWPYWSSPQPPASALGESRVSRAAVTCAVPDLCCGRGVVYMFSWRHGRGAVVCGIDLESQMV